MSPPPTCPSCGQQSMRRHCPPTNLTCPWDECVNAECKACVDRVTGQHSHPLVSTCKACGPVARRPAR